MVNGDLLLGVDGLANGLPTPPPGDSILISSSIFFNGLAMTTGDKDFLRSGLLFFVGVTTVESVDDSVS